MPVESTTNPRPVLRTTRLLTNPERSIASDVIGGFTWCGYMLLFIRYSPRVKLLLNPYSYCPTDLTSFRKLLRHEDGEVFIPFPSHFAIHVMNKDLPGKSTRKCNDALFVEMLKYVLKKEYSLERLLL